MVNNWISHTKSEASLFLYKKNLFKPVFEYKIIFWICVIVLWIHKGCFVAKKLEWNVVLKLSGIQIHFNTSSTSSHKIQFINKSNKNGLSWELVRSSFVYFLFGCLANRYLVRVWSCLLLICMCNSQWIVHWTKIKKITMYKRYLY